MPPEGLTPHSAEQPPANTYFPRCSERRDVFFSPPFRCVPPGAYACPRMMGSGWVTFPWARATLKSPPLIPTQQSRPPAAASAHPLAFHPLTPLCKRFSSPCDLTLLTDTFQDTALNALYPDSRVEEMGEDEKRKESKVSPSLVLVMWSMCW